jgi:hypothetical protein
VCVVEKLTGVGQEHCADRPELQLVFVVPEPGINVMNSMMGDFQQLLAKISGFHNFLAQKCDFIDKHCSCT